MKFQIVFLSLLVTAQAHLRGGGGGGRDLELKDTYGPVPTTHILEEDGKDDDDDDDDDDSHGHAGGGGKFCFCNLCIDY